nr:dsDNA nuclease domain-containing protein [uncultured Roseateles sp.]
MKSIETAKLVEDVGRDTLSRYDMQFQAAAYAALQILEGKGVDCVYCDFHDDFVVRRVVANVTTYHFFQVKTKNKLNHQWSLNDIFALKKAGQKNDGESLKKVRQSFAGKLLLHGIVFDDACIEATLLSNVYFHDDVVQAVDELRGKVPKCRAAKFLSDNFSAIFSITPELPGEKIEEFLGKLILQPSVGYIDKDRGTFAGAARSAIYEYSEIDLTHYETKELANGLVDLVYRKSKMPLEGVAPAEIASRIGVGLDDLLEVLSISRSAYEALLKGAEPKALKQASAIQRWLKGAGAGDEMVEYASMQKVNWDIWLRTARHNYSPLDLGSLLEQIDKLYLQWVQSGEGFQRLNQLLEDFSKIPFLAKFGGLSRELLFGAIGSVVVRVYSK